MIRIILILVLLLTSNKVLSERTDCSKAKVLHVQIEGQSVLYQQENAPWRTLGVLSNEDGTKERYAALLAAQMSGKPVIVGYPVNNFDCSQANYGINAYIVRTHNQ